MAINIKKYGLDSASLSDLTEYCKNHPKKAEYLTNSKRTDLPDILLTNFKSAQKLVNLFKRLGVYSLFVVDVDSEYKFAVIYNNSHINYLNVTKIVNGERKSLKDATLEIIMNIEKDNDSKINNDIDYPVLEGEVIENNQSAIDQGMSRSGMTIADLPIELRAIIEKDFKNIHDSSN